MSVGHTCHHVAATKNIRFWPKLYFKSLLEIQAHDMSYYYLTEVEMDKRAVRKTPLRKHYLETCHVHEHWRKCSVKVNQ